MLGCAVCRLRKKACFRFQEGHFTSDTCCACSKFNICCQGWSEPLLTDEAVLDQAKRQVRSWIRNIRNRNGSLVPPLNLSTLTSSSTRRRRSNNISTRSVPKVGSRLGVGDFSSRGEESNLLLPEWEHASFSPSFLVTPGTSSVITPFPNSPVTDYYVAATASTSIWPGDFLGTTSMTQPQQLVDSTVQPLELAATKSSSDHHPYAYDSAAYSWSRFTSSSNLPSSHMHDGNKDGFLQSSSCTGDPFAYTLGKCSANANIGDVKWDGDRQHLMC